MTQWWNRNEITRYTLEGHSCFLWLAKSFLYSFLHVKRKSSSLNYGLSNMLLIDLDNAGDNWEDVRATLALLWVCLEVHVTSTYEPKINTPNSLNMRRRWNLGGTGTPNVGIWLDKFYKEGYGEVFKETLSYTHIIRSMNDNCFFFKILKALVDIN
ncbi:hypothetical protein Cgig2_002754 [Carnegiea gigantea]|uniref:Uncharacterized protein n=1 Tax=Carnegiea gigantea TaxID=171969 RepID=A0A9Q1GZP7_9CARY|nr:hypothetical protein Cgig2_002754 [Carnegiea gigantea]